MFCENALDDLHDGSVNQVVLAADSDLSVESVNLMWGISYPCNDRLVTRFMMRSNTS